MEIRFSRDEDLPEIISLLKKSLGESLLPKSEGYWIWKHVKNPFGASPVLLATEGNEIIGVRAFMQWRWKIGQSVYRAVRAVDTATSPAHQGKGVFSKLTKALLEHSNDHGFDFVFNTPNEKSKPGYLKMGWETAGKLPIAIKVVNPISMALSPLGTPSAKEGLSNDIVPIFNHPGVDELLESTSAAFQKITTAHTRESLIWRYVDVPIVKYYAFTSGEGKNRLNDLVVYRMKPSKLGLELRITDAFVTPASDGNVLRKKLKEEAKRQGAHFITMASTSAAPLINHGLAFSRVPIGPIVTVRKVRYQDFDNLIQFNKWSPTTGDLELF